MRIALAAATAAALLAAPAVAAPYADIGDFAVFSFNVSVAGPANPSAGDTFAITVSGANSLGAEEFEGVNGITSILSAGFGITISTGASNAGQTISSDYDRSMVTDPAQSNASGSETGTLTFTLANTTLATLGLPGATQVIAAQGLLSAGDGGTFYDGGEPGSWSFSATINSASGSGLGSFTLSVPPAPSVVSEPALLAVAGVGLIGLAVARRRD